MFKSLAHIPEEQAREFRRQRPTLSTANQDPSPSADADDIALAASNDGTHTEDQDDRARA